MVEIDPAAQFELSQGIIHYSEDNGWSQAKFSRYILLKDGVMVIECNDFTVEGIGEDGKFDHYVTSKTFYPFGSKEYPKEISLRGLENLLED